MPRPQKKRKVESPHMFTSFNSKGFIHKNSGNISLGIDELEAIRLADLLGLDHAEAAKQMDISRSTFTRLIERARNKVAQLFIEGKRISVAGGNIEFISNVFVCKKCDEIQTVDKETQLDNCPSCGNEELVNTSKTFLSP